MNNNMAKFWLQIYYFTKSDYEIWLDSNKNQEVASLLCDENYVLDILDTHLSPEDLRFCSLLHLEFIIIFQFFQLFIHMYFYVNCLIILLIKFPLGNYLHCHAKWFYNFYYLFCFFKFYYVCVWICELVFSFFQLPFSHHCALKVSDKVHCVYEPYCHYPLTSCWIFRLTPYFCVFFLNRLSKTWTCT